MKTLNLYVGRGLVVITCLALGILTFVMLSANLIRAFDLLARGADVALLLRFIVYLIPDMLTYTLPMALLCATVLVFSRLSADNELTAMQASGISIWQIIAPGLVISIVFSAVCLWLHATIAPRWLYRADLLRRSEGIKTPLVLLEPGRFVEMKGFIIRVGRKDRDSFDDIHVFVLDDDGRVVQDITARRGSVTVDEEKRVLRLDLEDTTIASVDLRSKDRRGEVTRFASGKFSFPLDFGSELDRRRLTRSLKHMDFAMIFGRIYVDNALGESTTSEYVELHTRMAMALSPFAFLLLGIPLGIRSRRSETSVGLLVSLILGSGFYAFIVLADGLRHNSYVHPEVLVWLPNIVYQVAGLWAIAVMTKK
ncbi:MAG: hypothetical protein A3K19_25705 [Lentisphaerae bacterium RIFOXYB12_FULL_65_16]|nr:MAG: hypothetical protein A3K18_35105 [Lentisphaerae bacterium RIFOXYA12_64_32]OGV90244.1 MAG: hypothetical protein A3K19_25705 [Lentisphaerae bacterium RIFOXYB12_FULL_65_16]